MSIDPNNLAGTAHVTFDDEFNNLSLWSPSNPSGTWATTFWYQDPNGNGATLASNGEQEWYINANYGPTSSVQPWTQSNGILTLTAAPASAGVSPLINGYGYTSGEINTYHSFTQTYGYFEMRAQLPAGQGFWPAFWLMPENGAWPPELDVMEVLGQNTTRLYNTVHSLQTGSHTATGDNGVTVANMSTGYHTFGVDWEPDTITFYFDRQQVFQTATPADMHSPMYVIANLADGGYWPGQADGQTGQMNIDYIRAFASGAGPGVSSPSSDSTQTSTSSSTGQTYNSDNNGDHWTGTTGNDIFYLGRGGDTVTGGGGNDTFAINQVPWGAGTITDFHPGDVLDLNGMLADQHYGGPDPIGAGYLRITSNSAGDAQIWANYNQAANSNWWLVETLQGVPASSLVLSSGVVTETPPHLPIPGWHTVVTRDPLNIDHSGFDGLVFRNASTGDLGYMTVNAAGGETWHAVGPTSTGWTTLGLGDFNGDGFSGVAFRNTSSGEWGYMAVSPGGGEVWHDIGQTSLSYSAVGTGDFAGDGSWAVAFVNATTGDFGYMSVAASGGEQWTALGATSTAYTAYGAGDFAGNGAVGELFRNNASGDMGFMTANPGGGETWHAMGPTDTGWAVIGIGDFDGSGSADVGFRNTATGQWGYMSANPSGGETWHEVGPSSLAWSVLKVGDFDGSGHAEVAFRNGSTGEWGYMSPTPGGGEAWHDEGATSLFYYGV